MKNIIAETFIANPLTDIRHPTLANGFVASGVSGGVKITTATLCNWGGATITVNVRWMWMNGGASVDATHMAAKITLLAKESKEIDFLKGAWLGEYDYIHISATIDTVTSVITGYNF